LALTALVAENGAGLRFAMANDPDDEYG